MPITISKSKYLAGVQCLKRLFLLVHQPELGSGKTVADFALLDQGRQAGKLAQQLFPGGVEVRTGNLEEAIRTTQELIANPEVPAIFEAAFEHDGVFVRVDILQRRRDGRWRLIEVKSSASMKEEHLEDVAIQYRAVSKSALDVASCHLAIVNRQYVFPGGDIDPWRFFRIRNLTRKVQSLQPKLVFQLRSEFRVLAMEAPPDLPTGKHCVQPIVCEFFDHCNVPRPADHIAYLPYLHASAAEELEELGVEAADAALVDPGTNRMPQSKCSAVIMRTTASPGTYGPCNGSIGLWNITGTKCWAAGVGTGRSGGSNFSRSRLGFRLLRPKLYLRYSELQAIATL